MKKRVGEVRREYGERREQRHYRHVNLYQCASGGAMQPDVD